MQLWVVGLNTAEDIFDDKGVSAWAVKGIFDTKEAAIKACENVLCFIAPMELNQDLGLPNTKWEGTEYPLWDLIREYADTYEESMQDFPQSREWVENFVSAKKLKREETNDLRSND